MDGLFSDKPSMSYIQDFIIKASKCDRSVDVNRRFRDSHQEAYAFYQTQGRTLSKLSLQKLLLSQAV